MYANPVVVGGVVVMVEDKEEEVVVVVVVEVEVEMRVNVVMVMEVEVKMKVVGEDGWRWSSLLLLKAALKSNLKACF
ncbi:hypothetical protein L3X38_018954 [Prunus dulcis]|uniref:Uncharacterized protein n=1 Tax=Prunus dulcis TaxID=3755 RepID=A0AAD4ZAK6_PRUDU|nr:hypothetical protein L3X38_018954 [Prunus dulcis]